MAPQDILPLTRREALALEKSRQVAVPNPPTLPLEIVDVTAAPLAEPPRRTNPSARAMRRSRASVDRAVKRGGARPKSSFSSKLLSSVALLFAGILLVGMSVPANAFMTVSAADASPETAAQKSTPGQTLRISADAEDAVAPRDKFEVLSYAQVLALKYAGIDYTYTVTSGAVRWPFPYSVPITDGFGPRDGGFHKGVDFVPGAGTPIYAIADGVAVSAGYDDSGYGNHVVIQHDLGGVNVKSNYAHMQMDSSPIVAGQQIKVGDFLGLVGDTGIAYGAHLHFEIYIDDVPVDPFAWLQANASN